MISIIITTFNRPTELKRALSSIRSQLDDRYELLVVNDGRLLDFGTTQEILNLNGRLFNTSGGCGPAFARNLGATKSNCNWITFLDDDDEFLPNKIQEINGYLSPDFDIIVHEADLYFPEIPALYSTKTLAYKVNSSDILISNTLGGIPKLVIKREFFIKAGGFTEHLRAFEDYELNIKMLKHNPKITFLSIPLVRCNYIFKKQSVSKSTDASYELLRDIQTMHGLDEIGVFNKLKAASARYDVLALKALMNDSIYLWIYYNLRSFLLFPNIKSFLTILASIFGLKNVVKFRSIL